MYVKVYCPSRLEGLSERSSPDTMVAGMNCSGQCWKPVSVMMGVYFAMAVMNVLFKKILDDGVNHMVIATYRLVIATVFLTPIAYFRERKTRPKLTALILCELLFSALVGASLTQYFYLLGLKYTTATFSCAFINLVPTITFMAALPFKLEKVNMKTWAGRAKVLGTLFCVGGALVLILYKGMTLTNFHPQEKIMKEASYANSMSSSKKPERWVIGSILLIISCTFWSSWFLIQARISRRYPCEYSSTAILSFFAAIQSAILSLPSGRNLSMWVLKGKLEIISIIFAGMVGSGFSYVGMFWCVKQKGPVFTSAFTPFVQIFAAILDVSFLHDQIYLGSVLGSISVITGLYILLWGKSHDREESDLMKQAPTLAEGHEVCNRVPQMTTVAVHSTCER